MHRKLALCLASSLPGVLLSGCAAHDSRMYDPPQLVQPTPQQNRLRNLPAPAQKVAIAVYGFTDQTGQFKTSDSVQTLSRAVTQGATSMLVKALQDTSNRQFFTVIEREKLDNLLRERAVIREMRASYLGERELNPQALPPLLFAGILLEGGIIGYDSNVKTGGGGARVLGIGGSTQYREDTVTIYLRAVSTKTGEVLSSVSVRKSIASVQLGASAFRFVSFKDLLELEAGITYNEPDQLALTRAVEKAVYALVMEGAIQDLWCLRTTPEYAAELARDYVAERDDVSAKQAVLPVHADRSPVSGACPAGKIAGLSAPVPFPVSPAPVVAHAATAANQPNGAASAAPSRPTPAQGETSSIGS